MIGDENDEKLAQVYKVMRSMMYGMILVTLTSNYHIVLMSWTLFIVVVMNNQLTCNTNL